MLEHGTTAKRSDLAREAALAAAVRRFSQQSYDQVGLRQVAADASLDVARVHRLFGSKEALFAACVRRAFGGWNWTSTDGHSLAQEIAQDLLVEREAPEGDPLQMLVRSVSDPHAGPILRAWCEESFLEPVARILRSGGRPVSEAEVAERVALVAACCFGIAVMRKVMAVPALAKADASALSRRIEHLLSCPLVIEEAPHSSPEILEPAS